MYGGSLNGMFVGFAVVVAVIAVAATLLAVWLLPMLWEWIKPWLHAITG